MTSAVTPALSAPRWALVSAVAGVVANTLLIAFFVLESPWAPVPGAVAGLGAANDVMVAIEFCALVPVIIALRQVLRPGPVRVVAPVVAGVAAAVAILHLLLVLGVLDFAVQIWPAMGCFVLIFAWVLAVGLCGGLPRGIARAACAVGGGFLAGLVVAVLGLVTPAGSAVQYVAFGVAALAGLGGWLGFPLWVGRLTRPVLGSAAAGAGIAGAARSRSSRACTGAELR